MNKIKMVLRKFRQNQNNDDYFKMIAKNGASFLS